jgi:hypothetical protein
MNADRGIMAIWTSADESIRQSDRDILVSNGPRTITVNEEFMVGERQLLVRRNDSEISNGSWMDSPVLHHSRN